MLGLKYAIAEEFGVENELRNCKSVDEIAKTISSIQEERGNWKRARACVEPDAQEEFDLYGDL